MPEPTRPATINPVAPVPPHGAKPDEDRHIDFLGPDAMNEAGIVVVGLTDRWRRDGLGRARTAIATQTSAPTVLVRRGIRPGGLAPRESETRFAWTIAG